MKSFGRSHHVFIGDPGVHDWDAMAVVSYPSRKTFLEMVGAATNAEEQARRATGFECTAVIACTPAMSHG